MPLDRDKAREVLRKRSESAAQWITMEQALDALEVCMLPAPQQTIDRDALMQYLRTAYFRVDRMDVPHHTEQILALLRTVEGATS